MVAIEWHFPASQNCLNNVITVEFVQIPMDSVVLLTVDCLRRDHVNCYGYDRPTTPNINEFASDAAIFEGYSNCPGTRFAFQSIHTGITTGRIDGVGVPDGIKSLAEILQEAGYSTAGFANNAWVGREFNYSRGFDHYYSVSDTHESEPLLRRIGRYLAQKVPRGKTFDYVLEPTFNYLVDKQLSRGKGYRPEHSDSDTVDAALDWLDSEDDPYFLWVHFMDAHTPYGYWPDHIKEIRGNTEIDHTARPHNLISAGSEPPEHVIDIYDSCIRSVDEQIGRLLEEIEDATIILTGDHGEEFGENGGFHDMSLFESMTDVPFFIKGKNISENDGGIAQHLDILPTILNAANIDQPAYMRGKALQQNAQSFEDPLYFSLSSTNIAVQKQGYRLIEENGEKTLINITEDSTTPSQDVQSNLESLLSSYKESMESELAVAKGKGVEDTEDLSNAARENLEDLGYI